MARYAGFNTSNSKVILNVYDLTENNDIYYPWGLGFYHSGVQIGREEYTFASSAGIFSHPPKGAGGAKFRESIELGEYRGTTKDLETVLNSLKPQFRGADYNLLSNNCNHFANAFVQQLIGRELPGFVNRMAYYGNFFSCLLPPEMSGQAPVDNGNTSGSSNRGGGDSSESSSFGGGYVGRSNTRLTPGKSSASGQSSSTTTSFSGAGRKLGSGPSDSASSSLLGLQDRRRSTLPSGGSNKL